MKNLLGYILIFIPQLVWGQFNVNSDIHRKIVVTQGDSLIETTVLRIKSANNKTNPNLDYYWYENNQIHINQGGFSGWLLDGDYHLYALETRQLIGKGGFKSGLKTGEWKSWDKKGRLMEQVTWKEGVIHGLRMHYRNGILTASEQYYKGALNGKTTIHNPNGTKTEKRFQNGKEVLKVAKDSLNKKEKKASRKKEAKENADSLQTKKNKRKWNFWMRNPEKISKQTDQSIENEGSILARPKKKVKKPSKEAAKKELPLQEAVTSESQG